MLKSKFSRFFLLFGVILFLFVFVGCNHVDEGTLNNEDNSKKEETLENEEEGNTELSTDPEQNTQELGDTGVFLADFYVQDVLSWVYSLKIVKEDDKIYINDVLYEYAPSAEPPVVLYTPFFFAQAADNQELSEVLNKIQESKSCYILKTDENHNFGKKIAIYQIDGAYYFLRFYDDNGYVMRIHRAIIQ